MISRSIKSALWIVTALLCVLVFAMNGHPVQASPNLTPEQQANANAAMLSLWNVKNIVASAIPSVAQVKSAIDGGADINARNANGDTPLTLSAWAGDSDLDLIEFLISNGADENAQANDGDTALTIECKGGYYACVQYLVSHGANVNVVDETGYSALSAASQRGSIDCVRCLVANGANINAREIFGTTPLIRAMRGPSNECVKFLISNGADVGAKQTDGTTALMTAAESEYLQNKLDCLELLVAKGAYVNAKNDNGDTALIDISLSANVRGKSDCLRFFVAKGADVNAKQKDGMTALMWASLYGDVDCVKDLISNGADVNAKDNLGETALTDASNSSYKNGLAPVFDGPSDMVTMSERYWNACRFATKEGKSACVKLLAEHGADLTARNDYPQWAFKEALGMHAKTEMQHMADKHWFLYFTWFRKGGDIKFQDYILSDNGAIDMRRNMWNLGVQWNSASITNNAAFRVLQLLPPLPTGLSEPTNVSPSRLLIVSHLENKMWITKYYDLYELPVAIKSMITAASKGNHPMPPLPVFR